MVDHGKKLIVVCPTSCQLNPQKVGPAVPVDVAGEQAGGIAVAANDDIYVAQAKAVARITTGGLYELIAGGGAFGSSVHAPAIQRHVPGGGRRATDRERRHGGGH